MQLGDRDVKELCRNELGEGDELERRKVGIPKRGDEARDGARP